MKLFVDTAHLEDIESALGSGAFDGVTTNPSLLAKEQKCDFYVHVEKIIQTIRKYGKELPLSVEVFSIQPEEIRKQALEITRHFRSYKELYIKVQIGWNELGIIKELSEKGIKINCTACMSISQSVLAAKAGADFVSIFWGRIRDGGEDPFRVVQETRKLFDQSKVSSEIIVGSIRKKEDVEDSLRAGAHIVTVPPKFFPDMITHPRTKEVVDQFMRDFSEWIK